MIFCGVAAARLLMEIALYASRVTQIGLQNRSLEWELDLKRHGNMATRPQKKELHG